MNLLDKIGITIIECPNMHVIIKRSWKERLFALPWRPWVAWKRIPDPQCYYYDDKLFMHPETARRVRDRLNADTPSPAAP